MNYKTLETTIREVVSQPVELTYVTLENAIKQVVTEKTAPIMHHVPGPHGIERDPNDQVSVGTYRTKHFEMSPDAQLFFTKLARDADMDKAEKVVMMHDKLFGLWKQLKVQGGATNDEKRQAKDLVDRIRFVGDKMGLAGKLGYLDDHLKEINKLGSAKVARNTIPKERTGELGFDKDIDNSKMPLSRAAKMQRKIKIIDED